jgi:hypothetical protein
MFPHFLAISSCERANFAAARLGFGPWLAFQWLGCPFLTRHVAQKLPILQRGMRALHRKKIQNGASMKRVVTIIAMSGLLTVAAAGASAEVLSGQDLRKAVTGKTVYLRQQGIELPISYRANGTMSGRLSAFVAALGGTAMADSGKWWISNDQLCQRWSRWLDGKSYCYKLSRKGSQVRWRRNDGRTGTVRLSG